MAIYSNFEGTFKNEFQIGKQGATIKRSETDNSLTLSKSDNTALVDINAKEATFNGTGAVKLPSGTTAEQPTPVDGIIRHNSETGYFEIYSLGLWRNLAYNTSPYDLAFFIPGPQPYPDIVLGATLITEDVLIPSSCGLSVAKTRTPGLISTFYDVRVNGGSIGTIAFGSGNPVGVISIADTNLVPGDLLEIINPTEPDTTLADVMITISGVITVEQCYPFVPDPPSVWQNRSPNFNVATVNNAMCEITSDGNNWMVGGTTGDNRQYLIVSEDNTNTWTEVLPMPDAGKVRGMAGYNGRFVVSFESGVCYYTDSMGVSWTQLPESLNCGASGKYANCITVSNSEIWIAKMLHGYTATSPDGINWSTLPNTGSASGSELATNDSGLWLSSGHAGESVKSINDGVDWNTMTIPDGDSLKYGMTYCGGSVWCCVGDESSVWLTTDDGVNWGLISDRLAIPVSTDLRSVASDGVGNIIVVGHSQLAYESFDYGVTWAIADVDIGTGSTIYNKVFTNKLGKWALIGDSSLCSVSPPLV